MIRRFGERTAALWKDRGGNFTMMMAIAAVPLLVAVGVAVDVARVLEVKSRLAAAADAAALAALAVGSPALEQASAMYGNGRIKQGEDDAANFFRANAESLGGTSLTTIAAEVRKSRYDLTSELNYTASVNLAFGNFLNLQSMEISGKAAAAISLDTAIDFYLLLDNTPSMGLGATTADINRLMASTPDKCAFACHALNNSDNYYNLAKDIGVEMRIDVVRQATQKLTTTAKKLRTYTHQYRMAVYTFGKAATDMRLTEVADLTDALDEIRNKADAIDLMTIPYQNYNSDQQTDFDNTLAGINKLMPNPGSGLQGDAPQKVLFFVSDGVSDSYKRYTCTKPIQGSGRCQEPIDTRSCKMIRDRGIKIAVLYTTYLPLPGNSWYNTWIKPFQSEIGNRMKECATPGLYFEVSPSEGIVEAMDALFRKTVQVLKLVG